MPCKLHILFCASLALALRSCLVGAAKTSPLLPKKTFNLQPKMNTTRDLFFSEQGIFFFRKIEKRNIQ